MTLKIVLFIFTVVLLCAAKAQNPSNDPNLELDVINSDEFNGTTIDGTKWDFKRPWSSCHGMACLTTNSANRRIDNGILKLTVESELCQCYDWDNTPHNQNYSSGAIFSDELFRFGYFEIRAKLPKPPTYPFTHKGFGPNFWLFPNTSAAFQNYPSVEYSELDIYEFDAENNYHTCNVHYRESWFPFGSKYKLRDSSWTPYDFLVNFDTFHTFACEWTPNYINFYKNDTLIRSTNVFVSNLIPMNICVDINVPATNFNKTFSNFPYITLFPYTYEIDYVRIYKIKMDCNTTIIQSNFNFSSFEYAVKKSFTLSNSTVPSNTKVTLRATNFLELKGTFIVPFGSELTLSPTPCFNQ